MAANYNLAVRRNHYDQVEKDLRPSSKDKAASGEEVTANGTADTNVKAIEDVAKDAKKAFYCYSCGIDCTRIRYHYAQSGTSVAPKVRYDLCANCYSDGRAPAAHTAAGFVKLEDPLYTSIPDKDVPWSDAELLLLLEGLELFDENWNSISDHVGTRTREECVLKFLQLEIEDQYLDDGAEHTTLGALNYGRIPFDHGTNPVLSVVSFLAAMSSPEVTAAAAGRSVDEIRKSLRTRIGNGASAEILDGEVEVEGEGMKREDSMEIDRQASLQPGGQNRLAVSDNASKQSASPLSSIALATAAARAGALASHEERAMTRLVAAAVNTMLQKFELKLAQFAEMEALLRVERQELERGRRQLFLDRLAFKKRVQEVQNGLRKLGVREGGQLGDIGSSTERKLGFMSVTGRAEEDIKPLGVGEEGYHPFEV